MRAERLELGTQQKKSISLLDAFLKYYLNYI